MTTDEIVTRMQVVLSEDAAIESWCQQNFARSAKVFLGADIQNLPKEEHCPALVIKGWIHQRGTVQPKEIWNVGLSALVSGGEAEIVGNRITYLGILQADQLRILAEKAIYRSRIAAADTRGDVDALTLPRMYESFTVVTFTALRSAQEGMG